MSDRYVPMARALLSGLIGNARDESIARKGLAVLFRRKAPLDRDLRRLLASLFDPPKGAQLKIEIVGKGQGRRSDPERNTRIAAHVYAEINAGKRPGAAVASAAAKFHLSEDMIRKIWGRYRAYGSLLLG
jgi:hypothetical protein